MPSIHSFLISPVNRLLRAAACDLSHTALRILQSALSKGLKYCFTQFSRHCNQQRVAIILAMVTCCRLFYEAYHKTWAWIKSCNTRFVLSNFLICLSFLYFFCRRGNRVFECFVNTMSSQCTISGGPFSALPVLVRRLTLERVERDSWSLGWNGWGKPDRP